jgi:hypothetical protein
MPLTKIPFVDRVRRLFADRRAAAAAENAQAAATRARLAALDTQSVAGARFSLVGLSEMREQLGERWPELSERVHDLAQAVIQRHLARGDVFDAHGDDGYVILFNQLTQAQAEFKCRVIAKEIAAKLLGADWAGRASAGIVFELAEAAVDSPAFEAALDEAIARGRPVAATEPPTPEAPRRVTIEPADEAKRTRTASPVAALKPIDRDRRATGYTPIWDFGVEALLRFRFSGPPPAPGAPPSVLDDAKADIAALNQVLFDASRLLQAGRRLPVICPVRLETIVRDGWRSQIVRMLRGAPPSLRKLVTLEIVIAADNDADWIGSLERAWRSVPGRPTACVPLKAAAVPQVKSDLVQHLNLRLAGDFAATKSGIDVMGAFAQKAERAGMTCGILGLRTRAAALAATAAGFRQLSGPAIHPDVATLGQPIHFDLMSLYRDLLPQAG